MLAIVLALIGALLFALGNVLQQRIAMGAGDELAHSPWFMVRLARSRVWLLGIAATLVGFVFHAAALDAGTLVVVQPTLALTLVFALPLGALLSRQAITRRDVGASIAITVGLVFFLILSQPAEGRDDAPTAAWVVAGVGALALSGALTAGGLHRSPAMKAALLGTAAGILFGLHAALINTMVSQFDDGLLGPLAHWQVYAVIVLAFVSMSIAQISLQAGVLPPAIATASIATPLVGVILGVTLFQETLHDSAAGLVVSILALAVVFAGIAALSMRQRAPRSVESQVLAGEA